MTRPNLATLHAIHGAAATVTTPEGLAASTTVVGSPERPVEFPGGAAGLRTQEMRKPFAIRRDQVSTVPTGTTIVVLEGPDAGVWRVDAVELKTAEETRVLAVRLS